MLIGLSKKDTPYRSYKETKVLALSAWKSNNSLTRYRLVISYLLDNGNYSDENVYDKAFREAE
jgi:hypothetical protein